MQRADEPVLLPSYDPNVTVFWWPALELLAIGSAAMAPLKGPPRPFWRGGRFSL
jgi:hypothetical protein